MKRLILHLIILIGILFLTACGNSNNSEQTNEVHTSEKDGEQVATLQNNAEIEKLDEKTATQIVNGIMDTFKELGKEYKWLNDSNPADFNILRPELLKYATENYTDSELKTMAEEIYCECAYPNILRPSFDVRFDVIESTSEEMIISTVEPFEYANMTANSSIYTFTLKDDGWKLDHVEKESYTEKPLNLTQKEVERYLVSLEKDHLELIDVITHNGRELYILQNKSLGFYEGIYADSTELVEQVPNEWLSGMETDNSDQKTLYRVRSSWDNATSQKGAFHDLNNAKREADRHSGYKVFDENGKCRLHW